MALTGSAAHFASVLDDGMLGESKASSLNVVNMIDFKRKRYRAFITNREFMGLWTKTPDAVPSVPLGLFAVTLVLVELNSYHDLFILVLTFYMVMTGQSMHDAILT